MRTRLAIVLAALLLFWAAVVQAQGPYVGEIRMWTGIDPPEGWVKAEGQLMLVDQYPELFDVIGYTFCDLPCDEGVTFRVPHMVNRVPVGQGGDWAIGDTGGSISHTLTIAEMPAHNHSAGSGSSYWKYWPGFGNLSLSSSSGTQSFSASNSGNAGGGQPHNNMPPYLAVNFIIRAEPPDNATPTPTPTDGPTPTPTLTPTPTATPTPPYAVYTYTLESNNVLAVNARTTFGQVFVSGLVIVFIGLLGLMYLTRLVYRE